MVARFRTPAHSARVALALAATATALLLGTVRSSAADPAATAAAVAPIAGTHCRAFPADDYWNTDISSLPVDPRSATWLSHMSTSGRDLHPDFGPSGGDGPGYGIPITVVSDSHRRVKVHFQYADQSDHVRYPLGKDTLIEGGRNSGGDMHAVVVDRSDCRLYETWDTREVDGRWRAGSGATWSLTSDKLRPNGWTSADAAGLPILPGLLRWSEVKAGHVDHAIRFTTDLTSSHHLWPARHDAGSTSSWSYPPMGARFRLDASFSTTGFGKDARVVIAAMKRYGLVLADNGSPWYFQGARSSHWPATLIAQLKQIPASAFQAVDTGKLEHAPNSGRVK